ncbi:MAG: ATP-binding protein [Steroidobacteraceae bacterium]
MSASENICEELKQRIRYLESQVDAVTRELEAVTYSVSHDLRAPLRSISGYCQVLQEELSPTLGAEQLHYMDRIQESAGKLSRQIDALLELSRTGRAELNLRDLDLTQQALAVIEGLPDRPAHAHIDVQPGMRVHADTRAMQTILQQLLHNAVKVSAGRSEPRIAITQQTRGDRVTLCVADNGVGFDPKYADRLFAPFQRLHSDPALSGTGIGLALVQRLAARHGGRVWAESQPEGGAQFYVELPSQPS